jgi:acyl-CoA thioesterase I
LPDPEGPTMATCSPALISRLTPDKISREPAGLATRLERFAMDRIQAVGRSRMCVMALVLAFWSGAGTDAGPTQGAPGSTDSVILVVGDSLSAAYGLPSDQGWTTLLNRRIAMERLPYRVVNASISGDTTANGLARLPRALAEHRPDIVIIELGGNDGLRGLSLVQMKHNIESMIRKARAAGAKVLLVGIELPPNYGRPYTERFHRSYREIAAAEHVPLAPFLLQGIATHPGLMQADGIHANAKAQPRMLENVWPLLRPLL